MVRRYHFLGEATITAIFELEFLLSGTLVVWSMSWAM
jgi:hypothetical protein